MCSVSSREEWRPKFVEACKMARSAGSSLRDRARLLAEVWEDPDFKAKLKQRFYETQDEMDLATVDLPGISAADLVHVYRMFPNDRRWDVGNFKGLYADSVKELNRLRVPATKKFEDAASSSIPMRASRQSESLIK